MTTSAATCPQCAQPLAAGATVCPQCGYQLTDRASPETVEPLPPASAAPAAVTDQATERTPAIMPVFSPQPTFTAKAAVAQAKKALGAARAGHPRITLTFVLVMVVVSGVAMGISHYLPNLPLLSRFAQAHATATVVPAGTVLFHDALTTKTYDWTNDQHCSFAPDGYHVRDGYECYAPTATQRDITLSATARQLSGPTDRRYGLGLRLNAAGDEYLFAIDSNGHWLFGKHIAGVFTAIVPPTASAAIKQGLGSTNTLTVRAIGSHFEFAVNGTPVGAVDNTALDAAGYCGVEGSRGIEIVFTSLTIAKAS